MERTLCRDRSHVLQWEPSPQCHISSTASPRNVSQEKGCGCHRQTARRKPGRDQAEATLVPRGVLEREQLYCTGTYIHMVWCNTSKSSTAYVDCHSTTGHSNS